MYSVHNFTSPIIHMDCVGVPMTWPKGFADRNPISLPVAMAEDVSNGEEILKLVLRTLYLSYNQCGVRNECEDDKTFRETALLNIHNVICMSMDSGKSTALVVLDLSAAFDTWTHSSIIELLSGWYGISGTALNWVRSYL